MSQHAAIPATTGASSMLAWQALRYGAPDEALAPRRVLIPTPGPGELRIRVAAASLNPIDLKLLRGDLKRLIPLRFPRTIGFDAAGEVDAVGAGARFAVGDQVFVRASRDTLGAFAQYSVQPQDFVARAPAGLDPVGAASLPLVGLTTVQGLVDRAAARAGQRILIHAGSGGLGSFAIQYARHLGLLVIPRQARAMPGGSARWVHSASSPTIKRITAAPAGFSTSCSIRSADRTRWMPSSL